MAWPFFIILLVVAVIFALRWAGFGRKHPGNAEALCITSDKNNKRYLKLNMNVPLRMTLVLDTGKLLTGLFADDALFPRAKSGIAEFDEAFTITAYREDVMALVRRNSEMRNGFLQLLTEIPSLTSIGIEDGKFSLSLDNASRPKDYDLDWTRETMAAFARTVVDAFASLPPDTPLQARARKIDVSAFSVALASVFVLTALGAIYSQPLATGLIAWKFVILGGMIFVAVQMGILFAITTQGVPRMRATIAVLFASLFATVVAMQNVVTSINASSPSRVLTEKVEVANLYKIVPRKGAQHFYVLLKANPSLLATERVNASPALELPRDLYYLLENGKVRQGSHVEISEAIGLLGLPFVLRVRRLDEE